MISTTWNWCRRSTAFAPRRHLVWLASAYVAGIAIVRLWPRVVSEDLLIALTSISLIPLLVCLFARRSSGIFSLIHPLVFFCMAGMLAAQLATPPMPAPASFLPFMNSHATTFIGEVVSPPEFYQDKTRLALRLESAFVEEGLVPVEGGVLLTAHKSPGKPSNWLVGDRLLAHLSLKPFHNFNNPGGFDYARFQADRGLYARANAANDRSLIKLEPRTDTSRMAIARSSARALDRFRQNARLWLERHLQPDTAGFYAALLLGYQTPKEWAEHVNRAGVSHIVAISGSHLCVVSMMAFWIVSRLLRLFCPSLLHRTSDQHIAIAAAFSFAALYALISGLALPTWRALVMLTLSFACFYWQRSSDTFSALAGSAIVILLIDPSSLWQATFQLTFASVIGLLVLYPRFRKLQSFIWGKAFSEKSFMHKAFHPFLEAFWISLSANIMVLPIVAYHFRGISLAGFFANTVLVPAMDFLVLPLGLTSLAIFVMNEHVALPLLHLGAFFLKGCQKAILWFSNFSWSFVWVGNISVLMLTGFYLGLAFLLSSWNWQRKALSISLLFGMLFGIIAANSCPSSKVDTELLRVSAIDVGQGTATLIQFPTGQTMLVDGGGFFDDTYDIGKSVLAPFLWDAGIRRLDYVVLSHDHPDHRNGLFFVLSHFEVGSFWQTGITEAGKPDPLTAIADRRSIPVMRLPHILGDHAIGPCRVSIIHPDSSYIDKEWDRRNLNNVSLVLRITYGETQAILPGDIDQSVERVIFENEPIHAMQVLLLSPHHGSRRSNGSLMLDKLHPCTVVFSCGFDNNFGFPSPHVIERCRKRNIPHYRTDYHGCVKALSNGSRWELRPYIGTPATFPSTSSRLSPDPSLHLSHF